MAQEEKYGTRDLTYSAWHRVASTQRYVGWDKAQLLGMIDIDAVPFLEFDDKTKEPLGFIEIAMDVGQNQKPATVIKKLGEITGLPAYVVLYKVSDQPNPSCPDYRDIESFRVKRLHPNPEFEWRTVTPQEWAEGILKFREWSAGKIEGLF